MTNEPIDADPHRHCAGNHKHRSLLIIAVSVLLQRQASDGESQGTCGLAKVPLSMRVCRRMVGGIFLLSRKEISGRSGRFVFKRISVRPITDCMQSKYLCAVLTTLIETPCCTIHRCVPRVLYLLSRVSPITAIPAILGFPMIQQETYTSCPHRLGAITTTRRNSLSHSAVCSIPTGALTRQ
jgi:hypothetical protein